MNRTFIYESQYGPDIRVGILQKQDEIRIDLRGKYAVTDATGAALGVAADKTLDLRPAETTPATLTWHIVAGKAATAGAAEKIVCPQSDKTELAPWQTECLGAELSKDACAIEYWRCSRPFATEQEANAVRDTLPNNETLAVMAIRVVTPQGTVTTDGLVGKDFLRFTPVDPDHDRVRVHNVIVGIEYHWRHKERQRFRGVIEVRVDNAGKLTVVNEIPVEQYLFSVNSSEMMSVMPDELLKSQTVAARNTVFATMDKHHHADDFHICADDHCQCYRGSSRETADSRRLTMATFGQVLTHKGQICDCRYSKSCGGLMESMDSVWHEAPRGYLPSGIDADPGEKIAEFYPCNTEEKARVYLHSRPHCWCNTTVGDIPSYLNYTKPYFRWTQTYKREELEQLIGRHLGTDIGELTDITVRKRGDSARAEYIRVKATKGEWTIGKEFNIRKALSQTFLYSSAFVPEFDRDDAGHITTVRLVGGGWGHGAGLCQIGATMMAYKGRLYDEILLHYFPNTTLVNNATQPAADVLAEIIKGPGVDTRADERCFEFFNCYSVADCPLMKEGVELIAREKENAKNEFFFEATGLKDGKTLPKDQEFCKQLQFSDFTAEEKK